MELRDLLVSPEIDILPSRLVDQSCSMMKLEKTSFPDALKDVKGEE